MKSIPFGLNDFLVALVVTVATGVASAHAPEEKAAAFYGGVAHTTAAYNLELLVEDGRLRLYVRDRKNRPLNVDGSHATALAWGKAQTEEVQLKPGENNALEGAVQVALLQRVIVTLQMRDQEPVKAWFTGLGDKEL